MVELANYSPLPKVKEACHPFVIDTKVTHISDWVKTSHSWLMLVCAAGLNRGEICVIAWPKPVLADGECSGKYKHGHTWSKYLSIAWMLKKDRGAMQSLNNVQQPFPKGPILTMRLKVKGEARSRGDHNVLDEDT